MTGHVDPTNDWESTFTDGDTGPPTDFSAVSGPDDPTLTTPPPGEPTVQDQVDARAHAAQQKAPAMSSNPVKTEPVAVGYTASLIVAVLGLILGSEVFDSDTADTVTAAVVAVFWAVSGVITRAKVSPV